ncbi:MAG: M23 family metallopeptidase [Elusimicrobia bacterium]|nr:M23 family metallopeptidase [Elusimicrobiota bacterium]
MRLGLIAFALVSFAVASPMPATDWARFSVLTPAGRPEPGAEFLHGLNRLAWATHTLGKTDQSITNLAKAYGTNMQSLQATNNNELMLTAIGQKLTVQNREGLLYRVRKEEGETLDEIIKRFRKDPAGFAALKKKTVEANDLPGVALLEPYEFQPGEAVLLPGITLDFDTYRFPFAQPGWHRISSGFGNRLHPILRYRRMHAGLDLPKPFGTPVYASRSGRVIHAGWAEGYGKMVEIRHTDGWSTRYGHLSTIGVAEGQWVTRGKTLLGRVGNSGLSTGPHLHFEVRDKHGRPINPRTKIGKR